MRYVKTFLFLGVTVGLAPFYFVALIVFYPWRLRIGPRLVQFYSKVCLLIFRVRIDKVKHFRIFKKRRKSLLIVSNHSSFLDIFILSALFGASFVSKREVKSYPIIGQIASLMGVIFFDRASRQERIRTLKTVAKNCTGRVIAAFPQGTTGRITDRLPFSRGIFKVIELNPEIAVLPITLRYSNDAEIAWSGGSLKDNAVRVAGEKMIHVKVAIHQPVKFCEQGAKTASEICAMVEETVRRDLESEYKVV
jgi:1-acyl-sn-glycerol-3-phosphate acyltransferase